MHNYIDKNNIWRVEGDVYKNNRFGNILLKDKNIGVKNWEEDGVALQRWIANLRKTGLSWESHERMPLPPDFPKLIMNFPSNGFAPDYFTFSSYKFCSLRLRNALAQMPDVIDYTPIDLRCQDAKAVAQDYQRMRVIAQQPAMDMERSLYEADNEVDPDTGKTVRWIRDIEKIVLREDFEPRTEIFCMVEDPLNVLATDALAERVLKAGCTGLEFRHLETPDWISGTRITVRTKNGTRQRG